MRMNEWELLRTTNRTSIYTPPNFFEFLSYSMSFFHPGLIKSCFERTYIKWLEIFISTFVIRQYVSADTINVFMSDNLQVVILYIYIFFIIIWLAIDKNNLINTQREREIDRKNSKLITLVLYVKSRR